MSLASSTGYSSGVKNVSTCSEAPVGRSLKKLSPRFVGERGSPVVPTVPLPVTTNRSVPSVLGPWPDCHTPPAFPVGVRFKTTFCARVRAS